ncbi:hypothetical protein CLOP_g6294 [Closterium sp. NIES-67]|nr:hypothetical protein CLOP_g6294 [Closterium sp. NIES-67]
MRRAVHAVGGDAVAQMLVEVDAVQRCGGQLTADGKRRRTPGGVFWNVLRARVSADVYIEIMAQERDVQKRRDRGQARKKRRKQQQQQGKGVSGSGCLASCSAASANKEGSALDEPWCDASHGSDGSDGMSLSVDGLSDADHDALDDAHAATDAADVAQDAWTGRHARNGMSAHVDGRLQVGHGVRVRGGDMVDGMAARVRLDVAVASGAVKQVHHAWRCAVMAGGGAGGEDGSRGGGGEVLAVERHGTHAAASSIAGEGAAVSTPLPCDASESTADRHGSAGGEFEAAAAVEAVHRAGEGGQRVPVKQRLRMPVTYDDVPLVAEGAVRSCHGLKDGWLVPWKLRVVESVGTLLKLAESSPSSVKP